MLTLGSIIAQAGWETLEPRRRDLGSKKRSLAMQDMLVSLAGAAGAVVGTALAYWFGWMEFLR